ncbi:hypothetical protein CDD82_1704 [Ophiocordyceps australis]|uniref:Histone-lysine N-methyltransferase n=1 Tax=Ophiocordyceps australis TaxID=1399860 RepID=A0A2C5YBD1_9HYPO|nr:hypothetical protein CDD82_1704 [Ophiocordyceps australis]
MALFAGNGSSAAPTEDTSSNVASWDSTPPTTVADSVSLHSDSSKHDVITVADDAADAPPMPSTDLDDEPKTEKHHAVASTPRARRTRVSEPVYNLVKLSGTDGHGKRRANGDVVADRKRRRRTHLAGSIQVAASASSPPPPDAHTPVDHGPKSTPQTRRRARESLASTKTAPRDPPPPRPSVIDATLSRLGRRVDKGKAKLSRELKRLQDTKEYAGIEDVPVVHTVWSNGKYVDPSAPLEPPAPTAPKTKARLAHPEEPEPKLPRPSEPITNTRKQRGKKFLDKGLYAGQDAPRDIAKGLTPAEKKKLAQIPQLATWRTRHNKIMPPPLYTGLRTLIAGRDFKLPYHVCNPLPPGQPKPDEWKKMTKNRFIGDSKDYWRKMPHLHDYQSKCVCKPEDGCGESCQNRIMLYECDATNCNIGKQHCTNRAFADLSARRAKGGKYRVGVEVIKTADRGYGVRSNRSFGPNQIIMEYAGEIITEEECERRMNEVYRDNECYYLMSFDQNMIIDATTGSIARFVNHSCNPNCRMIKWIVSGQPRMALFAGDKPIMTGDELTYDYNFDPFSAKNVQACLCGEANCRGVLGPKPREVKVPKTMPDVKAAVKATVKAGKRKLRELLGEGGDEDEATTRGANKKRKTLAPTGIKGSLSTAGIKAAKGAATALKRSVSTITVGAKKAALAAALGSGNKGGETQANKAGVRTPRKLIKKKSVTKRTVCLKTAAARQTASRSSSLTIVAKGDGSPGGPRPAHRRPVRCRPGK